MACLRMQNPTAMHMMRATFAASRARWTLRLSRLRTLMTRREALRLTLRNQMRT